MNPEQKMRNKQDSPHYDWAHRIKIPDWVRKMKEYYKRTGTYRPEDLRRLLGDPTKSIEMDAGASLSSYFHQQKPKQ